ncbi:magnesium-dependent phosphatase-1 [Saccharicrinis sp. FJH54]|uniref:magnesium-dependent phosphatase-1 n=1 Tax=Saccharicrinis sp. FJH54 TaxID=3344665 RepID=UPI0035D52287
MKKSVFVFDLDFTIWDAGGTWCDCTTPPYRNVNAHILDYHGAEIRLYKDVRTILDRLKTSGKIIAAASRTNAPEIARELLERFRIRPYFDIEEIYPSSKDKHLSEIMHQSKMNSEDLVFFDDELRNIRDVSKLGIKSIHIPNGITAAHIEPYL